MCCSLVPRLSPQKRGGGESLVTSAGKVVDFRRLALAEPIRLHNETTCTRDILSTQQKLSTRKSVDYSSKVGEKQFPDVRKGRKSSDSKNEVLCSWFAGPTRSPYFAAPSLHVQSASRNLTELPGCLEDEERNCK